MDGRLDEIGGAGTSAEGLVVVGTAETIAGAMRQLEGFDAGAFGRPFGVVTLDSSSGSAARSMGMRVLGTVDEIESAHARTPFGAALVSLPGAMGRAIERVRTSLESLGVDVRFLTPMEDVLGEGAPESAMGAGRSLDVQRLIGRSPGAIDPMLVTRAVTGRRVLITGAGGSIGSELARICGAFEPEELVLMERSENALFEIDAELGRRFPGVPRRAVLHDVVEPEGTMHHFAGAAPEVVFHAAAHKHVPMMEDHPSAALNNNLFGTKSVADAARAVGCARFVLISTDKAVNPSSVMGATKRLAELYVRSLNGAGTGRYSLVRFGNVLGSACSVVPIWSRQLSEGGPITVTHESMTRYFMTIPEAAALVIQSSTIDPGVTGGVFELDMGEPVRIRELAERFVRMHGFEPVFDGDRAAEAPPAVSGRSRVRIRFTGVRPGEKLHEELAYQAESLRPTGVPGVLSWSGEPPAASDVSRMVGELAPLRRSSSKPAVLEAIGRYVPTIGISASSDAETEVEVTGRASGVFSDGSVGAA